MTFCLELYGSTEASILWSHTSGVQRQQRELGESNNKWSPPEIPRKMEHMRLTIRIASICCFGLEPSGTVWKHIYNMNNIIVEPSGTVWNKLSLYPEKMRGLTHMKLHSSL